MKTNRLLPALFLMSITWVSQAVEMIKDSAKDSARSQEAQMKLTDERKDSKISSSQVSSLVSSSFQVAAQYFAGLDAPSLERQEFQKKTASAWDHYERRVGQPLAAWSREEVAYEGGGTVFYPFSGPDFLTVERIYPDARRYVLVAQQKALKPVDPVTLDPLDRQQFEKKLGAEWELFGSLGYFRTDDLNEDQKEESGNLGVTTTLMAFAARLGYEVIEVFPLRFNVEGGRWESNRSLSLDQKWTSVRLVLRKEGRPVILDYLSMDLSDDGLRHKSLGDWVEKMSHHPTLLKAASHLLQEPYFKILSNDLAQNAPLVVQDETGLSYPDLEKIGQVKLYGNFIKSQVLFKSTQQPELAAAYAAQKTRNDLPFAFSYLKSTEKRSLQVARRQ